MRIAPVLLFLFVTLHSNAQHANHWLFGKNVHIEFRKDSILQHRTINFSQIEGTAAISDSLGNLVYFVPNDYIYRKDNSFFTPPLYTHESATQGVIILRHLEAETFHFVTSIRNGLTMHSIVKDDSFVQYRHRFPFQGGEKQQAVNHQNGRDIWYANHAQSGDSIFFFLLKKDGLINCPVIAHTGNGYYGEFGFTTQGQMKFSANGQYLAEATFVDPFSVGVYKFNNEYPITDSIYVLTKDFSPPYTKRWIGAIEFAPNNSNLYLTTGRNDGRDPDPVILYQLVLDDLQNDTFGSSWRGIDSLWGLENGDLQIAPNGKIYLSIPGEDYLAVINNPNDFGAKCNYVRKGLTLDSGGTSLYGLPTFNQSYFYHPSIEYKYEEDCINHNYSFWAEDTFNASNYSWTFTDLTNSTSDSKSGKIVKYQFPQSDSLENPYSVRLIASNSSKSDTITKVITIRPKLKPTPLGNDTFYCAGDSFQMTYRTPSDLHCIHWNGLEPYSNFNGDTIIGYDKFHETELNVDTAGTYTVRITNKSFCQIWDTVQITEKPLPQTPKILENIKSLSSSVSAFTYRWYYNDSLLIETNNKSFTPEKNGYFQVQLVSEFGCVSPKSDSFLVDFVGVENLYQVDFNIYPNPSNGLITIDFRTQDTYTVEVFDVKGRLVSSTRTKQLSTKINIKKPGNYLVLVRGRYGNFGQHIVQVR